MSLTPAQAVTLAFLLGMLTVLVLLYAADAIQRRHRRKRRLPTPQPRQREDALPTRVDVVTWGGAASRERWWTEN